MFKFKTLRTVDEIRKAQRHAQRMMTENRSTGFFGRQIQRITMLAARYSMQFAPVFTGTLRASITQQYKESRNKMSGRVFIRPNTWNSVTRGWAYKYGIVVHERPGKDYMGKSYRKLVNLDVGNKIITSLMRRYDKDTRN